MKKQSKGIIEKVVMGVAKASSETASWFCYYEPKVPKMLLKENKKDDRK